MIVIIVLMMLPIAFSHLSQTLKTLRPVRNCHISQSQWDVLPEEVFS